MYEDVRTSAVSESLVGDLLSQTKFLSEVSGAAGFEFALAENKSH